MFTDLLADNSPSFALSVRTYAPVAEKVADVFAALALKNVTVPGPLVLVHAIVRDPVTRSSLTDPLSNARSGIVIV